MTLISSENETFRQRTLHSQERCDEIDEAESVGHLVSDGKRRIGGLTPPTVPQGERAVAHGVGPTD
jgi:hypothetical protein